MAEMARHGYRLTPGTLYPLLHRLERAGFLTHEDRNVDGRRRRYYRGTDRGAAVLAEAARRLPELVGEVLGGEQPRFAGEVSDARSGDRAGGRCDCVWADGSPAATSPGARGAVADTQARGGRGPQLG